MEAAATCNERVGALVRRGLSRERLGADACVRLGCDAVEWRMVVGKGVRLSEIAGQDPCELRGAGRGSA